MSKLIDVADEMPEPMRNVRASSRPLLFRTGNAETPMSIWGTCFLVGRGGRCFAVTAAHLIHNAHSTSVVVLPCLDAKKPLRLSRGFTWERDASGEYDAIVYEVSIKDLSEHEAKSSRIIRLDYLPAYDWQPNAFTASFFLMGYPAHLNEVDYDNGQVLTNQVVLAGHYLGPWNGQPIIHRVLVENPLELVHFRGMSGSPVKCLEPRLCSEPAMRFCGIAIWGNSESGIVHFLEAKAIVGLLDHAVDVWDGRLPDCSLSDSDEPGTFM